MKKIKGKIPHCPLCHAVFARIWSPSRNIHLLACRFDKIAIAENDPFVGRWDEALKGEVIPCPACDYPMRYFATSTGYMQAKCPKKKCQAKVENSVPDRQKDDTLIYDAKGNPLGLGGIDRPIATPEKLGTMQ